MAVIEIDVVDFLPLGQSDTHRPTAYNLFQSLPLTQVARTQIQIETVEHFYSPMDVVAVQRSIRNLTVSDYLELHQQGGKNAGMESLIDIFFMWQEARLVEYEQVVSLLAFTQIALGIATKGANNTLVMTDVASCLFDRSSSIVSAFTPISKVSVYTNNKYLPLIPLPTLTGPNAPEQ